MDDERYVELRCKACGHRETVGVPQMVEHLRGLGMFKRQKDVDEQLVRTLYADQIPLLSCGTCGEVAFSQASPETWDDDPWSGGRMCEVCRGPIAAARLEVFPDARRCTRCQQADERGEDSTEAEYCPRCGAIMQLRLRGGAGLARYVMRCGECGYGR